jgi:tetratricopeptide (TPR) repeat protein
MADRMIAAKVGGPIAVEQGQGFVADIERSRGHLAESIRRGRLASQAAFERGSPAALIDQAMREALVDAWDRERPNVALARADSALAKWPLASIAGGDRPYWALGMINALAGRLDVARTMATEFERNSSGNGPDAQSLHALRSIIAMQAHKNADAVDEAKKAQVGRCYTCTTAVLAQAYDLAGQSDSAIAVFSRFVNEPAMDGQETADGWYRAGSLKRLGELYEAKGDREKAKLYYGKFVDLWKTADPDLQPKVAEVRRRLARLGDAERR